MIPVLGVDGKGNSLLFFLVNVAVFSHRPHCAEGWPVKTAEARKVSKCRGAGCNLSALNSQHAFHKAQNNTVSAADKKPVHFFEHKVWT